MMHFKLIENGPVAHCLQSRAEVLEELVELMSEKESCHVIKSIQFSDVYFWMINGEIGYLTARHAKMVLLTSAERRSVKAPGL